MRIFDSVSPLPARKVAMPSGTASPVTDKAPPMGRDEFMARTRTPEFQRLSALQRHAAFFDQNADRTVTFSEVKQGFKDLGAGSATSTAAAGVFTGAFGPLTSGSTKIDLDQIAKGKHPSDTGAFTATGEANPERIEHLMTFDANQSGSVSREELKRMIAINKEDVRGAVTSKAEFGLLLAVAADKTEKDALGKEIPALSRGRLQSFYDGTLFFQLADAAKASGSKEKSSLAKAFLENLRHL